MAKTKTIVKVLNVEPAHGTGLKVTLAFEKTKTSRFLWFKPKIEFSSRVESFTNYHDISNNFYFHTCNCPDVSSGLHVDSWDYWLHRLRSEQYIFYPITRNEIRVLVDEWFRYHGYNITGEWPD